MEENVMPQDWKTVRRVRLLGQPIGLGMPLTLMGGALTLNMALALDPAEGWLLTTATVLMFFMFLVMFIIGVSYLLTPFEKVRVSCREVQLCLGSLVLRRIPAEEIRSVTATTRQIMIRSKDCDLYRMIINFNGPWPQRRRLWLDWSTGSESALKDQLKDVNFLL